VEEASKRRRLDETSVFLAAGFAFAFGGTVLDDVLLQEFVTEAIRTTSHLSDLEVSFAILILFHISMMSIAIVNTT
jgi:hypothetical protein